MLTIIVGLIAVYLLLCLAAYLYQDRLIFPGSSNYNAAAYATAYESYDLHKITLQRDGALLHGWQLENPTVSKDTIALYFGGNGEDVVNMLPLLQKLDVRHIYAFNYRGYGRSEGRPSQIALYADALAIYDDIFVRHHGSENTHILVVGRSLGSAVAGHLATQRNIHGLVLLTPLKSAVQSGKRMMPYLPVASLIRHPFDLETMVKQIDTRVLMLVADADTVIRPTDSLKTYEAIPSEKELVRLPGVGHNNIFDNPNAIKAMQEFVAKL